MSIQMEYIVAMDASGRSKAFHERLPPLAMHLVMNALANSPRVHAGAWVAKDKSACY